MRSQPQVPTDRTWPLPRMPWIMRMSWSELLFAHWQVDPEQVAPLLPPGLQLDTWQGQAWVGVVPFLMSNIAPRCCPAVPKLSRFLELNVRTYVIHDGKPGVWFFSLDAENPIAVRVARATFSLPYMDAKMAMSQDETGAIQYQSQRSHRGEPLANFDGSYRSAGESFHAQPGTLEYWLTARYCLYSASRKHVLFRGEIDRPPWNLSPANCVISENTMGSPYGFNFPGEPHLLFAQPVTVHAWAPTKL